MKKHIRNFYKGGVNLMRKALVFLLVFGFILSFLPNSGLSADSTQSISTKYGDVNGDGYANAIDFAFMRSYLIGTISEFPVSNWETVCDVNADNAVNSIDFAYMRSFLLGIITEFPAESKPIVTPTFPTEIIYQAEQAAFYNSFVETVNSGYTDSGYVNYNNEVGSFIEWSVNVTKSGAHKLTFRYANGTSSNRAMSISINDNVAINSMDFNSTGNWTTWSEASIVVYLNQGTNSIRATALTSDGGPNVDYLKVAPTTEAVSTPTVTQSWTSIPVQTPATGARQMEKLDRGVVAVKVNNGVFVSWRMFGTDPSNVAFNLYRNGTKVNSSPITGATNYVDFSGNINSTYSVSPIINGQEQAPSNAVGVWGQNYLQVPIKPPAYGYSAGDCSTGDLNGDGQYDIVVKWERATQDNANAGITDPVYLEGYTLTGQKLWTINLGKNIRGGAHYTQFMVYDLDGDGKAEVACKTADGTVDGKGKVIGNASADYRNSDGYILSGPEYLTVFSGQTGAELSTVNYLPERGNVANWGDKYGNRVDRFKACIAYLDGKRPSLVMQRGYYTRMVLVAWDFRDGKLTHRWTFDSDYSGNSAWAGQGNHNLSVGDVDNDGCDEILQGTSAIDHNGRGLWQTGLGHGDAMHFGDLDPSRPGLEVWTALEGSQGAVMLDARTGEQIFRYNYGKDCGRACAADILASSPGMEMWASGSPLYSSKGVNIGTNPSITNFAIWWDGDELRELLDGTTISKYNGGTLLSDSQCVSCNGTKATPCLQADILGDWREEVIWCSADSTFLRIYTTTYNTTRRIYTLMHDPIYRLGIAWQNTAYNQPPHTGFFLGSGMAEPPTPNIYTVP
jgi:rhamnogalacturonan endolyase